MYFYGLAVKTGSLALQKLFFWGFFGLRKNVIVGQNIFFSRFVSKNKSAQTFFTPKLAKISKKEI